MTPVIYCFINQGAGTDMVMSVALASDGTYLAGHCSSDDAWAACDIGYLPVWRGPGLRKRELYAKRYPDGYELEWVDDPRTHSGLLEAVRLNRLQGREHDMREIALGQEVG